MCKLPFAWVIEMRRVQKQNFTLCRLQFNTFQHSRRKSCTHYETFSFLTLLPSLSLAGTNLFSVSMGLPILDISYRLNYTICGILCLACLLSIMFSRFIHVVAGISILSFLIAKSHLNNTM